MFVCLGILEKASNFFFWFCVYGGGIISVNVGMGKGKGLNLETEPPRTKLY